MASIEKLYEEVTEFHRKIEEREAYIRMIAGTKPFEDQWRVNPMRSPQLKEFWEQSHGDIEAIHQQISELQQARLERINELMGTHINGEPIAPTDFEKASVAHRPALMLDRLEEKMDHLIDERKRVMDLRMNAQNVVDAFERKVSGP